MESYPNGALVTFKEVFYLIKVSSSSTLAFSLRGPVIANASPVTAECLLRRLRVAEAYDSLLDAVLFPLSTISELDVENRT